MITGSVPTTTTTTPSSSSKRKSHNRNHNQADDEDEDEDCRGCIVEERKKRGVLVSSTAAAKGRLLGLPGGKNFQNLPGRLADKAHASPRRFELLQIRGFYSKARVRGNGKYIDPYLESQIAIRIAGTAQGSSGCSRAGLLVRKEVHAKAMQHIRPGLRHFTTLVCKPREEAMRQKTEVTEPQEQESCCMVPYYNSMRKAGGAAVTYEPWAKTGARP